VDGTVLVLSRKSLRDRPLWEWLDDAPSRVVLVTTPAAVADVPDVAARFRDHVLVDDYQSWATEWAAERVAVRHGVALVASSSEDDVLRAARLRERLGVPGQDVASATALRDKYVMKRQARAAGIAVPAFAAVDTPGHLLDFLATHGYPVVVKPRRGSASVGVRRLRDRADLADLLGSGVLPAAPERRGDLLVETYVDAPMYHVDGVATDGVVVHCWPSRYGSGNAETLWSSAVLSSTLLAAEDPATGVLRDFASRVVRALPAGPMPTSFHLEAWVDATGNPILCEIACRTGGGPIAATYQRAIGPHLSRENLRGQCGQTLTLTSQPDAPRQIGGFAIFPPGWGTFAPPRGDCPVPGVTVELHLAAGATAAGPEYSGDPAAVATFWAPDARTAADRRDELFAWWQAEAAWT
jgi:biotin carboxylase